MYKAPLKDMNFALTVHARLAEIAALPGYGDATPDIVAAVLEEGAKLAENVWAPLNVAGDRHPPVLKDKAVTPTPGFKDAYWQYVNGGWNALTHDTAFGGQGLPWSLGMAVNEMWQAANLSLSLCPLLTQAGIEAIHSHGSEAQQNMYLAKLISGEWAGTMNLTEPQAGTDLAAIRSTATKDASGDFYRLRGQKIFITFGDHDFTDNIIHLVLARIDGLPDGNDGLGLFIVPKFLVNTDGSLGERNDVYPVSLEHKLGIHGSPTCVMAYGDTEGAIAYLIGDAGKGLKYMFTMMNNARISVGLQGVAVCERAYQHALAYAVDRTQGFKAGDASGKRVAIIEHADVRRMLLTMKACTEAARGLAYSAGAMIDRQRASTDDAAKAAAQARVDLLTPLVKAWSTDLAVELSSMGVQVHGGMGFIEETGAAQYYRDARILPIYEGTNGIQSNDLLYRKILRDKGAAAHAYFKDMDDALANLAEITDEDTDAVRRHMRHAITHIRQVTDWLVGHAASNPDAVAAAAVPYCRMFSIVAGGHIMVEAAHAAAIGQGSDDPSFLQNKILTARFYAETVLSQAHGMMDAIMGGHGVLARFTSDRLTA